MSFLHRAMSGDPDAMSLGGKGAHRDARAPAVGIRERLCHLLAVTAPEFRDVLRAADLQYALGAWRAVVCPLAVIVQVELTQHERAPCQDECQRDRRHFHQGLLLHCGSREKGRNRANEPHSYRDLPVRLAEFGTVYRFEQTGELNGMTRVRGFTQDDAHLFITAEQVESELRANLDLVLFVLNTLGLSDYRVRLGFRDPASDKYVGIPEDWDIAQKALEQIVRQLGLKYTAEPGEAAFYGPKVDFVVRDCIGREWQLGTVQLDYNLPKRFELEYVGADNQRHRPIMIHRAPFGSMERFVGILIEHFAGAFPTWLAPEQVRVMTVSDRLRE